MSSDAPSSRTKARVLLKTSAKRTVERETASGRQARVIKRYHGVGIDGWFDGLRARSEFRLHERLFARGLAVPRALELRHGASVNPPGSWELVTECIEDAHTLAALLRGTQPWPATHTDVARSLGRLLADAHALGLDHPDLHPGNVLVGRDARVWLVDLRRARIRSRIEAREQLEDLVHVAAGVRELVGARFRARFLESYAHALPAHMRSALEPRRAVVRAIEREARRLRREHVWRARLRWTRTSSSCRTVRHGAFDGIASRELTETDLANCIELAHAHTSFDPVRVRLEDGRERLVLVIHDRDADAMRARWLDAVRLADHGLDVARPLCWHARSRAWAAFALPASAARTTLREGASFDAFFRALHDRALALREPERARWFRDEQGRVFAADVRGLMPHD